jgi:FkbM family methyltransferase
MLIDLEYLIKKYNIVFNGILHVGAHECEEIDYYEKYIDRNKILWIEAMEDKVLLCKKRYNNILIENAVISDKEEIIKFNISNNGQSSSFLELNLCKKYHPEIYYTKSYYTKTKLLKNIIKNYNINYNFINLDIQGAELKALKSMENYLNMIDYIYTEVNEDYIYSDCALINEIDEYLHKFNFKRVETEWYNDCKWGDAFYIKNKL